LGASGDNRYDGKWWLSVEEHERVYVIEGYTNCYQFLPKPEIKFVESSRAYESRLRTYLEAHAESLKEPVETLLWKMASPVYAQPLDNSGGEKWKGKWGYANGDLWSQMSDLDRLGFIKGFLDCYSRSTKSEQGTFSKPRRSYMKAISKWYGVKADDPGEIIPDRKETKIPDVLFRFHDKDTGDRAQ